MVFAGIATGVQVTSNFVTVEDNIFVLSVRLRKYYGIYLKVGILPIFIYVVL